MRPIKRTYTLSLVAAVAAVAVTIFIWRASAQTVINAGYDQFSTPNNAATQGTLSLPAGALTDAGGSPSVALNGSVTYEGGANVQGYNGDTVVERTANVTVPGNTPLLVIGLNLVSTNTVQIQFQDGTSANYSVSVAQSPSTMSQGTMTFNTGGTFSSSLGVNVQYTLNAPGEPQAVIDAAQIGLPAIDLSATGSWQSSGGSDDDAVRPDLTVVTSSGGVIIRPGTHTAPTHAHNVVPAPSPTPKPTATKVPIGISQSE